MLLETGACEVLLALEEEDILDTFKLSSSSTVSKEWKTANRNIFREIAAVCSLYKFNVKNSAEENKLSGRRNLGEMVVVALADHLYSIKRDWNDDYAYYDVFMSNKGKNMVKVLSDLEKWTAHVYLSRSRYNWPFATCLLVWKRAEFRSVIIRVLDCQMLRNRRRKY